MKKTVLSVISVFLCICLIFPIGVTAFAGSNEITQPEVTLNATSLEDYLAQCAADGVDVAFAGSEEESSPLIDAANLIFNSSFKTTFMRLVANVVNVLTNVLIGVLGSAIEKIIPQTSAINDYASFNLDEYGNFYAGMNEFLDAPAAGAKWHLGYAKESILPDDFGEKAYTMGGYGLMAETTETFDGVWVRTIILNDGTGRGNVVFCVLDAIGIANADVRLIREAVADFAAANNIVSINVSCTHTHSGIDLQGVWANTVENVLNNIFLSNLGITELKSGVDRTYLNKVIDSTAKSIKEAYADMTAGTLTLAKKNIAEDYLKDRTAPYAFDENLYRLEFTPDNANETPTIITTFGVHPENSGYSHEVISADFIPYAEEVLNAAGYNFVFIQGAVGTITYQRGVTSDGIPDLTRHEQTVRYGHEIGYILLGLTENEAECAVINDKYGDLLNVHELSDTEEYTIWYEDWEPVTEEIVAPMLNIANKQYIIEVSNRLLDIIGKVGITDYFFLYDSCSDKYYSVTECGYMELGNSLKVELCPGETYGELLVGGEGLVCFKYKSLREIYGENIIVFDLMNDAIGYLEPDDDYVMAGIQYSPEKDSFDGDTWCLISWGRNAASTVIGEFIDLTKSVR